MSDPASQTAVRPTRRTQGRPSAAEAAALPRRLLDAALLVFTEHGYARASMDTISRAAGVSRKTLYARYANKAEVLAAVVDRLLVGSLGPDPTTAAGPSKQDPRASLLALARELASLSSSAPVAGLNRLILAEAAHVPVLARLFADIYERAIDAVSKVLIGLRDAGHLPGLGDVRLAATLFIEMSASVPRLRAVLGQPMPRQQIDAQTHAAVDLLMAACRRR
ncbi:MAG: TetR/AcrR family transcriptional regulator [Burkholderiaceae bacterium]|nr:TetR/AcrR family transcriptional regulator [Burkholderiaceae bacterium]